MAEIPLYHSGDISGPGVGIIASATTVLFLAIIAVALRFWARCLGKSRYGPDDWTILLGLFLVTFLYIISVTINTIGFGGFQQSKLTLNQLERSLLIIYVNNICYAMTLPTIKLSILLLYRRIFPVFMLRRATLGVGALVMGWMISTLLAQIFSCTPVEASWKPLLAEHCISSRAFYFGNAISNLLLDVMILCLPMPMVWNLQMSLKRKISVCGIFLLGGLVCICSILRIVYLAVIDLKNVTYTEAPVAIWTNVEPCIGIVCACLPTLPSVTRLGYQKIRAFIRSRSKQIDAEADAHPDLSALRVVKLREAAKYNHHNQYKELEDACLTKATQSSSKENASFVENDLALQPIEPRQQL